MHLRVIPVVLQGAADVTLRRFVITRFVAKQCKRQKRFAVLALAAECGSVQFRSIG